jgi:hypothetical protein
MVKDIFRSPIAQMFGIVMACWVVFALVSAPSPMIEVQNCVLISVGIGVVVAYFPDATFAVRQRLPTQGDWLAAGIWFAWISVVFGRSLSLIGRAVGTEALPWFNTHVNTFQIQIGVLAGICHLTAPEAIHGWKPKRVWVQLGVFAAMAAMLFFAAFTAHEWIAHPEMFMQLRGQTP